MKYGVYMAFFIILVQRRRVSELSYLNPVLSNYAAIKKLDDNSYPRSLAFNYAVHDNDFRGAS